MDEIFELPDPRKESFQHEQKGDSYTQCAPGSHPKHSCIP